MLRIRIGYNYCENLLIWKYNPISNIDIQFKKISCPEYKLNGGFFHDHLTINAFQIERKILFLIIYIYYIGYRVEAQYGSI